MTTPAGFHHVTHLDALGIEHSGVVDAPAGALLVCRDPDGIPVEFFAST